MAPHDDLTAERADLIAIAKKLVYQINEIQPDQWDEQDDKDQARILAALRATRQEALREAIAIIRQAETWTPQSVLAILECLARDTKPDRLASEGG